MNVSASISFSDSPVLSNAAATAVVDIVNAVLMMLGSIILMITIDAVLLGISLAILTIIILIGTLAMPKIA